MTAWEKFRRWLMYNLLYVGRPAWDTGVSPSELIELLDQTPPGIALDVGCGTGTNLLTMAEKGWQVTGLDFAWLSVLQARWKLRKAGINARVCQRDVSERLDLVGPFDLVLDIGCFHSLSSMGRGEIPGKPGSLVEARRNLLALCSWTSFPTIPLWCGQSGFGSILIFSGIGLAV
jgi:SAM-dependent methyltransferase